MLQPLRSGLVIMALLLVVPAAAQDDALTLDSAFTSSSGFLTIRYPSAWTMLEWPVDIREPDGTCIVLMNNSRMWLSDVLMLPVDEGSAVVGVIDTAYLRMDDALSGLLAMFRERFSDVPGELTSAEGRTIAGFDASRFYFEQSTAHTAAYLLPLGEDGRVAVAFASAMPDEMAAWEPLLENVIETIEFHESIQAETVECAGPHPYSA